MEASCGHKSVWGPSSSSSSSSSRSSSSSSINNGDCDGDDNDDTDDDGNDNDDTDAGIMTVPTITAMSSRRADEDYDGEDVDEKTSLLFACAVSCALQISARRALARPTQQRRVTQTRYTIQCNCHISSTGVVV